MGELVDDLLSKYVEPGITDPVFITDYPVELSPFAKAHRTEEGLVERFEAYVNGMEIANAFTELNDPDEQRARFETQARHAAEGDEEAQPFDEVFLAALEQGMPPTGGVGVGIDRLVMVLTGRSSLREVVLFPAMRDWPAWPACSSPSATRPGWWSSSPRRRRARCATTTSARSTCCSASAPGRPGSAGAGRPRAAARRGARPGHAHGRAARAPLAARAADDAAGA